MGKRTYKSDLTNEQWEEIRKLIPPSKHGGRPRCTDIREVLNAIFYLMKTGCQWRLIPNDFPACGTVYTYFSQWVKDGTWEKIHEALKKKFDKKMGGRQSQAQELSTAKVLKLQKKVKL